MDGGAEGKELRDGAMERRIARAWRWLKHRLGLDGAEERREKERREMAHNRTATSIRQMREQATSKF